MGETLIIATIVFFGGSLLLLERRCLGQISIVQPLVVCAAAGYVSGESELGLWLGISIQFLSVGQSHYANWALVAVVAAMSMIYSQMMGWDVQPGNPHSLIILTLSIGAGFLSQTQERHFARSDSGRNGSGRNDEVNLASIEALVKKRILRGLLMGGIEALVGSALVVTSVYFFQNLRGSPLSPIYTIIAIVVPALGVAIAIGSLSRYGYIFFASTGAVLTLAVAVIL